ncbi:hypothetical protein [Mucilaginibacter sp. OK098]|uniref:hypothetical protein n=1 Tax=Mucilaginibacter sp. OK098 TaxID=1855297 RepID=UPI000932704B|nr:hypothetical protein [Mucilaginibacter sp. OK098]
MSVHFAKKGDNTINTTSITAYRSSPGPIDYSSTRGAIISFTGTMASSLAKKDQGKRSSPGQLSEPGRLIFSWQVMMLHL